MALIDTLRNKVGQIVYPVTKFNAVYNDNGRNLEDVVDDFCMFEELDAEVPGESLVVPFDVDKVGGHYADEFVYYGADYEDTETATLDAETLGGHYASEVLFLGEDEEAISGIKLDASSLGGVSADEINAKIAALTEENIQLTNSLTELEREGLPLKDLDYSKTEQIKHTSNNPYTVKNKGYIDGQLYHSEVYINNHLVFKTTDYDALEPKPVNVGDVVSLVYTGGNTSFRPYTTAFAHAYKE